MSESSLSIVVVSDSTGHTAESVVRAVLIQFAHADVKLRKWPGVRTVDDAEKAVRLASESGGMLVHTLVDSELRAAVSRHCESMRVRSVDLIGALIGAVSNYVGEEPQGRPGRPYLLDAAYFRRVDALEFSSRADDGKHEGMIASADIVLVGVSRTSKTPVSTYLAGQGFKVANVPIVRGIEPPRALFELPRGRVFALTLDPSTLMEIRQSRLAHLGVESRGEYADREYVFAEVRWALRLYRERTDWPIIDVTHMAVEETAAVLLRMRAEAALEQSDRDAEDAAAHEEETPEP